LYRMVPSVAIAQFRVGRLVPRTKSHTRYPQVTIIFSGCFSP
jgi:hypothetical protein